MGQLLAMQNSTASTLEVGDSFRDLVCELLRTQHSDALPEQFVGGTKVDITFSMMHFGKRMRYAVECKNYQAALTKADFEKIYPKYHPLLDARQIDGVLVVSARPLGSTASAYLQNWRGAQHLTIRELEESLLGIRRYIETLASLSPTDEAQYIEARFDGHKDSAVANIQQWLSTSETSGLAILGSYGQGKTSLARRVAGHFAKAYLEDSTQRIPILKKLGEVTHETRLEALFGAEFTADSPAPGYQFKTFEHLNRTGRLLVILDGFDEMKHAMTAADFMSNFKEFNRLRQGGSKVLLLGRPNALPSDAQRLVFRGMKDVAGQAVASPDFAPWLERSLAFFNEQESRDLLLNSLTKLVDQYRQANRFQYADTFIAGRAEEVLRLVPKDLLRRPVHVQLIAALAADPGFDFKGFNEHRLYDHFIRSMVERDTTQKRARKAISLPHRLQFQRDLAWWAWRRPGKAQGSFLRDEIPDSLFTHLPGELGTDIEGKRNEYIVSTLTEEKDAGVLYFAHRSFQEFLVAERLRLTKPDPSAHVDYAAHLTPDITAFLLQAPDLTYLEDWYDTLRACAGPLPASYLQFFASFPTLLADELKVPEHCDMWTIALAVLSTRMRASGALGEQQLEVLLQRVVRLGQDPAAAVATLGLLGVTRGSGPTMARLTGGLIERCLRKARPVSDAAGLSIDVKQFDFAAEWLGHHVVRTLPAPGSLDPAQFEFWQEKLTASCAAQIADLIPDGTALCGFFGIGPDCSIAVNVQQTLASIDAQMKKAHEGFLNSRRRAFVVASYDKSRKQSFVLKASIRPSRRL